MASGCPWPSLAAPLGVDFGDEASAGGSPTLTLGGRLPGPDPTRCYLAPWRPTTDRTGEARAINRRAKSRLARSLMLSFSYTPTRTHSLSLGQCPHSLARPGNAHILTIALAMHTHTHTHSTSRAAAARPRPLRILTRCWLLLPPPPPPPRPTAPADGDDGDDENEADENDGDASLHRHKGGTARR